MAFTQDDTLKGVDAGGVTLSSDISVEYVESDNQ